MLGTRMVIFLKSQAGKESIGDLKEWWTEVQFGLSEAGWLAIQLTFKGLRPLKSITDTETKGPSF